MNMRINKYLAQCDLGSRRKCEQLVLNGNISINGKTVTNLSTQVNLNKDVVKYNNKILKTNNIYEYIILNKPSGYISSKSDPYHNKTVYQLINSSCKVNSVGRLDIDTEGILLFTNDGELANRLVHPSFKIDKKYFTIIKGLLTDEDKIALEKGVKLEEGTTSYAKIKLLKSIDNTTHLEIIIHQGWKRQIKRMFKLFDYKVEYLKRVKFGCISLGNLPLGSTRTLTDTELTELKKQVGL